MRIQGIPVLVKFLDKYCKELRCPCIGIIDLFKV